MRHASPETQRKMAWAWPSATQRHRMAELCIKMTPKRTQGGHMEDTCRTRFGGAAKADTRRKSPRNAARAYHGRPFSKREFYSKLFGEKENDERKSKLRSSAEAVLGSLSRFQVPESNSSASTPRNRKKKS